MRIPKPTRSAKPRKAIKRTKRKVMPRCKHCAHPSGKHFHEGDSKHREGDYCHRCTACPGYEPARGIRQKRRGHTAAMREIANDLWSKIVRARPGGCECPREDHGEPIYQAAHGFGKKAYPAVRYLPINGWKLSRDCHRFYTGRPIEWDAVMRDDLCAAYEELRYLALKNERVDLAATVARLREELDKGLPG